MPISQKHVQTWLIIGEPGGTYSVSPAQVSQWVDYVMTTPALSSAAQAAGEKSVLYSDPNRQAPGGPMWTNDETTFAHDCNGNRITVSGSNTYLMDVHSTHLWALWPAFVAQTVSWGGVWSYIFEDSADEINTQRLSQLPCNFDQTDWTNNTNLMDQALGQTNIIYNGLGLIQGGGTQPGPAIGLNPTTQGGMSEDCYVGRTPTGYFYAPHWEASENTELQMAQQGKLFICHADAYTDASQSQLLRTYFYASFLLTYDRSTQIVNTEFLTPSGVTVMPEAQLVPTQPIQSSPGDISGLMQSSGVYGREYRACYLAGNYAGPCAAVVNPNHPGMQMAFPWPTKYHHTLAMSGYGVYDGGTVSTNGAAPPAMMDGGTAQIVFP